MRTFWSILLLVVVLTAGAQAQVLENSFHLNPTADTFINPAFQHSEKPFEIALGVAAQADFNSWNPALVSRYGNKELDEDDKDVILRATHPDLFRMVFVGQPHLGVKYNQFGLRASGQVIAHGQLPSEVVHVMLKGNEINKEYTLNDLGGEAAAYLEAAALFAMPINALLDRADLPEIVIGVSAKYLHGLAFGRFGGEATIETKLTDEMAKVVGAGEGDYAYSPSGTGFAVDFGASTTLWDKLKVDASILNLGRITWKDVEQGKATGTLDVHLSDIESAGFDYELEDATPGENIAWKVPRTYRIGASYKAMEQLTVLADLSFTRSEAIGLTSRQAVGVEYRPWKFMPIQAGLVKQSKASLSLDLGWGLKFSNFVLGVSLDNALGFFFPKSQGTGLNLQTSIRF